MSSTLLITTPTPTPSLVKTSLKKGMCFNATSTSSSFLIHLYFTIGSVITISINSNNFLTDGKVSRYCPKTHGNSSFSLKFSSCLVLLPMMSRPQQRTKRSKQNLVLSANGLTLKYELMRDSCRENEISAF